MGSLTMIQIFTDISASQQWSSFPSPAFPRLDIYPAFEGVDEGEEVL